MPLDSLKEIVSRKYGFWFYQLVGWGIFLVYDIVVNVIPDDKLSLLFLLYYLVIISFAFVITIFMRMIYRSIYKTEGLVKQIGALLFTSLLAAFIWIAFQHLVATFKVFDFPSFFNGRMELTVKRVYSSAAWLAWPFFAWSSLYYLIKARYDYTAERDRAERAQLLTTEAQLRALRYQINPHFLFNTLISIQGLMYHNTKLADKMLTELSEFLRYTLRYNEMVFVPLEDEFEIIEKYLTIQKIRFGDKLRYSFSINPETRKKEVLCFLLQPLAENAVKYGITSSPGGVDIRLSSDIKGDWLILEIVNTGNFEPEENRSGAGLSNVRERLVNAYPDKHEFEIIQVEDKVHAIIKIIK